MIKIHISSKSEDVFWQDMKSAETGLLKVLKSAKELVDKVFRYDSFITKLKRRME